MSIDGFMDSHSEKAVAYRYLDLLAERSVELEGRIGLDEISQLRKENQQLRARLAESQRPGLDTLLVFLPVIFRNFWMAIRPDELALLAGSLSVPSIPSPCPEPGAETIALMKKQFVALPPHERASVIQLVRQLQQAYRLEIRPGMKPVVGG